jgi:ELWxxDGT repeat protein
MPSIRLNLFENLESRTLLAVHPLDIGEYRGRPGQWGMLGNAALFTTTDLPNGQMLWATDGTVAGTRLVKNLDPEPATGATWFIGGRDNALVVGDKFYFTGVDNAHGRELWVSDGTTDGTRRVADLVPGAADSEPEGFVALNGQLIFTADRKIWRSDGTAAGTYVIMHADPLGFGAGERMAAMNGHVYFTVYPSDSPYNGEVSTGELWRTDGTVAGTVMVRDLSPVDPTDVTATGAQFITVGGTLYFAANNGANGYELYRSDGTKTGTKMIRDLAPPGTNQFVDGSYPTNLTDVNGTLFFTADGFLWKTDGTAAGTEKLKTVFSPRGLVNVNGMLFFVSGENIWVSDGTRAGTRKVADGAIAERFGPGGVGSLNGRLYFGADGGSGFELYETDGTLEHTALVYEAQEGPESSHAQVLGRHGSRIIFTARNEAAATWEVFALDIPQPYAPEHITLSAASDAGMSDADRTTNLTRPAFSGTAPPDSVVRLFAGEQEVGHAVARGGRFEITSNVALPHGTHTITATTIDDARQTSSASAPLNVKIDTAPPRVSFKAISRELLELKFSEYVGATLDGDDIALRNLDTGEELGAAELHVSYTDRTNTAQITIPTRRGGLANGRYRITIRGSGIRDVAGNTMTQPTTIDFTPPVGPAVGIARNVLRIDGTNGDDTVLVRVKENNASRLQVEINGQLDSYSTRGIDMILVDALAGDDSIRFDNVFGAVQIATKIYAGDGNDTIAGSHARDRVYAGRGDDLVMSSGGHDILYGDAGNDTLKGERGNDYLVGGAGMDLLEGNHGSDRFIIEGGIDQVSFDTEDEVIDALA